MFLKVNAKIFGSRCVAIIILYSEGMVHKNEEKKREGLLCEISLSKETLQSCHSAVPYASQRLPHFVCITVYMDFYHLSSLLLCTKIYGLYRIVRPFFPHTIYSHLPLPHRTHTYTEGHYLWRHSVASTRSSKLVLLWRSPLPSFLTPVTPILRCYYVTTEKTLGYIVPIDDSYSQTSRSHERILYVPLLNSLHSDQSWKWVEDGWCDNIQGVRFRKGWMVVVEGHEKFFRLSDLLFCFPRFP